MSGKNKHAGVSAKKPKSKSQAQSRPAAAGDALTTTSTQDLSVSQDDQHTIEDTHTVPSREIASHRAEALASDKSIDFAGTKRVWKPDTFYTRNDKILHHDAMYICRRSHLSEEVGAGSGPDEKKGYRCWKLDDEFGEQYTAEESDGGEPGKGAAV
jgi:hypothetical protein